jgi:hypothetical protein
MRTELAQVSYAHKKKGHEVRIQNISKEPSQRDRRSQSLAASGSPPSPPPLADLSAETKGEGGSSELCEERRRAFCHKSNVNQNMETSASFGRYGP